MDPSRFLTSTLERRAEGRLIADIMATAVGSADPYRAVQQHLGRERDQAGDWLCVGAQRYDLLKTRQVLVLAVGKAATPMARAAIDIVGDRVVDGLVIPKATEGQEASQIGALTVLPSAHPVPDVRSMEAGEGALNLMHNADEHALVVVLVSGGGSALMTAPRAGLTLDDMRELTDALLASGATINEINALRRRLDRVKGGGLLRAAHPARVVVLVLSDVVGDDLQAIASGPFVAQDERTDAQAIIERYHLHHRLSPHIVAALAEPVEPFAPALAERVHHTIIANVESAINGASVAARQHGFAVDILDSALHGEAKEVGIMLAQRLLATADPQPFCLLAGGETTVTLRGDGRGGRNQELALSTVQALQGRPDLVFVALATDGGDGPTDAAGAVVDGTTFDRGWALGLDPDDYLRRNDAYHYFAALGDLIKCGPTETNVNDLALLFGTANL